MAVHHTRLHRLYNVQPRDNGTKDGEGFPYDRFRPVSNRMSQNAKILPAEANLLPGTELRTCIFPHVFSASTGIADDFRLESDFTVIREVQSAAS
jgi:hypothetical protein